MATINDSDFKAFPLPCESPKLWSLITTELSKPDLMTEDGLFCVISRLFIATHPARFGSSSPPSFVSLRAAINALNQSFSFVSALLPCIRDWALSLPSLFISQQQQQHHHHHHHQQRLPLLLQHHDITSRPSSGGLFSLTKSQVKLTRVQIRSLLSNAFFCDNGCVQSSTSSTTTT